MFDVHNKSRRLQITGLIALFMVGFSSGLPAATVIGLTLDNRLRQFDSGSPGIVTTVNLTGLQPGEHIVAIDFRPLTGRLYGLGDSSRLYMLNTVSGAASAVSGAFTPALAGAEFGFDFNPVVDRVRVVSNSGQNLRLNPDTGAAVAVDSPLAYVSGDINFGIAPNVAAVAYSRNYAGAATTVLYGIDASLNVLVIQNPPNAGVLNTVGPLGEDPNGIIGFDIWDLNGQAFAAMTLLGEASSKLFTIDLTNGRATLIGVIGGGGIVQDLAVVPAGCSVEFGAAAYVVDETNGVATINVIRRGGTSGQVSMAFATSGGTATANGDYVPVSTTLTFADGETNRTVAIPIVNDREAELTETVNLSLSVGGETVRDAQRSVVLSIESSVPLPVYALTVSNTLARFDRTPSVIEATVSVSGLQPGERLLGIDFRPSNGRLYALGSSSRLYDLNSVTGVAVAVSAAPFSPLLSGTEFGFDFNPVVDRVRVVSNTGQNLRLNPDTGAVVAMDSVLNYAAGDVNSGVSPRVVASAYTQNFAGAATTTLFGLDAGVDAVVLQNPPNLGVLATIGNLLVNTTDEAGFDYTEAGGGVALASLTSAVDHVSRLYRVELTTGAATLIGGFGIAETVRDLAIAPSPAILAIDPLGGSAVLSWPADAAGYLLQSSDSLFPTNWSGVSGTVGVVGNRRQVTNVVSGATRFYRLSK